MTVMFCDMVGSTPLAELLDPEEFREVLSDYQHACVRAIERVDGYTARYIGDAVVAYFGYPRAHEDDARRAAHAALGILDELRILNERLRESRAISLQVRIGLHSGVVVVGDMGGGELPVHHEIVGEMPHIAARLESIAEPGSVVISDATRELVEGYFETESLGKKMLKGVSRPIGVHRLLRPTGAVGRLELAAWRPLTPLVGRKAELARLAEAWQGVERGSGALVHVTGEAGIGKSRLVHALTERFGQQLGTLQTWQCSAHYGGTALYPVIRCLERLLALDRTRSAEERLNALEQAVRHADLDPGEAVPLLADLLAIGDADEARGPELSPRDSRAATLRVLESLLVADPARHPLLLVVEDLQWADPTTMELLGRIIANLSGKPVMCILTFRPGLEPDWARQSLDIELGPLASEEVRAMVAALENTPDPAVVDWVEAAADGVPLFVEEILKVLDRSGGALPRPSAAVVPPTLEGLLTERLDQLPDLGDLIDVASVLGREFDGELLEALEPLGSAELQPALNSLVSQGILRPVAGTRSRFEFTHALLQEAAYEHVLRRRRSVLHRRVADTLSRRFAAVAEREPEVVAHHWTCAAEPAKAAEYWRAAGTRALTRAAYLEAAEHFRRALEAFDQAGGETADDLDRADLLTHRAASLQAAHGYAAAGVDAAYAKARSAYQSARDDDRLVGVIRGEWMFHLLRGHPGKARELADEMLSLAQRSSDPAGLAEGHLYRGLVHMYLGELDLAREHLDQAFALYRPTEHFDEVYGAQGDTGVGALAYGALVLWNLGHAKQSSERSDLSLELAEKAGGQVTRAQAWGMRSVLHLTRGEPAEFRRWVDRSHAHSVEYNIGYWRTVSAVFSGWLHGKAGELEAGITRLEESLDAYTASGSTFFLPHFYILLADLRLAAGDHSRALDVLRAGEEYIEATGERFSESELFRFKARALMAGPSPDAAAATAAYQRALAAAREQNAKLLELRAASQFAVHQRKIGEATTALEQVASLCDWFGPASEVRDVARARELLAAESMAR
jgi:class 3 adenylate cyclase/predicted ATPase